ncbi:MAG TPA: hypothetical protein VFV79_07300, partial [Saprospiraceae bacterium]|nr:hypothetical protein [Saprospiraceae bacterium]
PMMMSCCWLPIIAQDKSKLMVNPSMKQPTMITKIDSTPRYVRRNYHVEAVLTKDSDQSSHPADPPPKPTSEQLQRKGPSTAWTYEWKNLIGGSYEFQSQYPLVNLFHQIYADGNLQSGYFYYFPNAYNLEWKPSGGYSFFIKYLASTGGSSGEATVTAQLTPNISNKDLSMAAEMLKDIIADKADLQNVKDVYLVSAPLASPPKISINQIASFGIDPSQISVTRPSNLSEPITISWKMKNVENLMTALFENVGLSGNLFLQPAGEGMPEISIPFNMKLNDQNTFGKFEMDSKTWRSTPWVNTTSYPLILKNIHVMKARTSEPHALTVYTWQAGNVEIPPGALASIDATSVPTWIDSNPSILRMWLDYDVKPCSYCDQEIQNTMIGGAKGTRSRKISFDVFDPIEYTGAKLIKLKIRSVQADPNSRTKIDLPTLNIHTDNTALEGGVLFVPEGSEPEFEFYLQVIMPDGTIYESDYWEISKDPDTNIISQALIKRMVKTFHK